MEERKHSVDDPLRKKRERVGNFTTEEVERLLNLIESRRHILESKKSDIHIWQEKERAWAKIEKGYNCNPTTAYRNAKQLKHKYEALKRGTRKAVSKNRVKGKSGLSPIELRVKRILSETRDSEEEDMKSEVSDLPSESEPSEPDDDKEDKYSLPDVPSPGPECRTSNHVDTNHTVKSKPKRTVDRLLEARLEAALLQKQLLLVDIEQKSIQRKIYQEELEHKRCISEMQKEEMRLKIELLKRELESRGGINLHSGVSGNY